MRITSIQRLPRKRLYEVTVDFVMVAQLSPEVLAPAGLRPGQEITSGRLAQLEEAEARHSAMTAALRALAYRPRSEREMADTLKRRSVPEAIATETMGRLRELGLLDDGQFAASYVETRDRTSPRGRRLIAAELAAKGVPRQAAAEPLSEIDEADAAHRAGARKARSMKGAPYTDFERRLGDYLLRRGFGFDVSRRTVRDLWRELRPDDPVGDTGDI